MVGDSIEGLEVGAAEVDEDVLNLAEETLCSFDFFVTGALPLPANAILEQVEPGLLLVNVQKALRAAKNLLKHLHELWLYVDVKIFSTERLCYDFEANSRWR